MSTNNQQQQNIPQQQQPTIDLVIGKMRDDILRTQSTASTASIIAFDKMVEQLRVFASQINDRNIEVARLQELCIKNKINIAVVPQEVKLPANNAVIPPDAKPVVVEPPKPK